MIEAIYSTNPKGETLQLNLRSSSEEEGLLIFNVEGLGAAKATVNSADGPSIEGVIANSVKIDPRNVQLTLVVSGGSLNEESNRAKLYKYFPIKKNITFRVVTDGGKDVYGEAYVEQNEVKQFAKSENAVISLLFPNPYLFDYVLKTPSISSSGTDIVYTGEVDTGGEFLITFIDDAVTVDITVTNDDLSQSMTIDSSKVWDIMGWGPGYQGYYTDDQIWIDTRSGSKKVWYLRGTTWNNIISATGPTDDWISLTKGNNTLNHDLSSSYGTVIFKYREKYEGV